MCFLQVQRVQQVAASTAERAGQVEVAAARIERYATTSGACGVGAERIGMESAGGIQRRQRPTAVEAGGRIGSDTRGEHAPLTVWNRHQVPRQPAVLARDDARRPQFDLASCASKWLRV